jgi:hypothetical protein
LDPGKKFGTLVPTLDAAPVEFLGQANVCVETRSVLVKMQECSPTAVEDSSLLLHQSGDGTEFDQEWLEPVECSVSGVFHLSQIR